MKYQVSKQFAKDAYKSTAYKVKLKETIANIEFADSIAEIINCSKMTGHKEFFKIRVGSFRLGFELAGVTIILRRFLHRKDIYKYFPPKK
ncbi:MAG: hypothetical protein K9H64_10240 [Bacteroidales bacterium]|nr:hypothetical protein [Bacteroidales bacterium]MCF8456247.1 hypothetical protein [Bacteroidales bacterium]